MDGGGKGGRTYENLSALNGFANHLLNVGKTGEVVDFNVALGGYLD